ncbi:MAG: bleomycin resistance family protein [Oxalicibacterium faecigallinarum]|uniref:Glyoxalase/fosfomycin resistance/dioxygenase domain-containing protein n=1 Tax=Oxalicibacterium faecigallinarum TaxID=573741 RepID=A0A8J3F276_9BURK|nr:VOC family protein [Oxalicibacterium faecigallinarum]MDQ7968386.1 bleomycin resistance family protein [Oxalicibacterium faecigallinarum]GGI17704.1 hypothetical protein GCM10008066_10310 [Oxalicibacterium faecigallinarum]
MSITLLLRCQDMEKTADFYRSILDFRVTISAGILTVEKHGGKIVFTDRDLWNVPVTCSGTVYFTVPNIESYYSQLEDKNIVVWPIQEMSYSAIEFGILDCNGYYLAFQQKM